MNTLKNSASTNTVELNKTLTEQAEAFKQIIKEERESFFSLNNDLLTKFNTELGHIPMLQKRLSDISEIPSKLDKLIERIEKSNDRLVSSVSAKMDNTAEKIFKTYSNAGHGGVVYNGGFPRWMRWVFVVSVIVVALSCVGNTVYGIWFAGGKTETVSVETPSDSVASIDSVMPKVEDSIRPQHVAGDNQRIPVK